MKRVLSLVLMLVLLTNFAVPAMAAFPETGEEARAKFTLASSVDEYEISMNEILYTLEFVSDKETGELKDEAVEFLSTSICTLIAKDTVLTVTNIGDGSDYSMWIDVLEFIKQDDGKYLCENPASNGNVLRDNGCFVSETIGVWKDDKGYEWNLLEAGESVSFTGQDMFDVDDWAATGGNKDENRKSIFVLRVFQEYPSVGKYWSSSFCFIIDDTKTAEMINGDYEQKDTSVVPEETAVANPFTDVSQSDYYYNAVLWALENGVTTGTTATTFGSDATCTRGQAVTFLWRAMGSPEPTSTNNPFTDVNSTDYFYKPVLWAVEQGITNGTSATTFSPFNTVTRGQTITFIHRAMVYWTVTTDSLLYTDVAPNAYYYDAVVWATAYQIAPNTFGTKFGPERDCPRAEIVYFIFRALNT